MEELLKNTTLNLGQNMWKKFVILALWLARSLAFKQ